MVNVQSIPLTLEERLEVPGDILALPGTMAEYIELLDVVDYQIEYHDQQIIALSYASYLHEKMVGLLAHTLISQFSPSRYDVITSNHRIHIPNRVSDFAPDLFVVDGQPDFMKLGPTKTAVLNPHLVVEILSEDTRSYDLLTKLPAYKSIESVEYILYIETDTIAATLYYRDSETRLWCSRDYDARYGSIEIGAAAIELADVYP